MQALLEQLDGGPIEIKVRESEPLTNKITKQSAAAAAGKVLGISSRPSMLWAVTASDHEYMGDLLHKRPCGLLAYDDVPILDTGSKETSLFVSGFALVDASNGIFWELFTKPKNAWWKRLSLKNEGVIKRFEGSRVAKPANIPPNVPLSEVLRSFVTKGHRYPWNKAEQIIIRHFLYTETNRGWAIRRIEMLEIIPTLVNVPTWYISLEGLNLPEERWPQPVEEHNLYINSLTGNSFGLSIYR